MTWVNTGHDNYNNIYTYIGLWVRRLYNSYYFKPYSNSPTATAAAACTMCALSMYDLWVIFERSGRHYTNTMMTAGTTGHTAAATIILIRIPAKILINQYLRIAHKFTGVSNEGRLLTPPPRPRQFEYNHAIVCFHCRYFKY